MNNNSTNQKRGSVLITALMTITIITLICATSLYVASQNTNTGMQTAGWQQSLTGAESGIDAGVRALNAYINPAPSASPAFSNWYRINTALPTPSPGLAVAGYTYEPSATSTPATVPPTSTQYLYLPSAKLTVNLPNTGGEGATQVKTWVTIDTAGMSTSQDAHGQQWYRIRSTSQTVYPTGSALLKRVSNNRLDNDLRNTLALNFSRKGGSVGPTRTIEVVLKPLFISNMPVLLRNDLLMSGGGVIDHFNSSTTPVPTFLSAPGTYRSTNYNETLIGMLDANGSDLKSTYVYGEVAYSTTGAAPKNTTNIQGNPKTTTPFSTQIPSPSDPTGLTINATYGSGSPPFSTVAAGTKASPKVIKVTGDFTVPGGQSVSITAPNPGSDDNYVIFWITGKFTTSGTGYITQAAGVHSTWYIDSDITTSGDSYINGDNSAAAVSFIGVGTSNKLTISGSSGFIGTVNAPGYDATISGSGSLVGSIVANTLNISGGASVHYDDALTGSLTNGAYAFASWFEDNSNPTHKDVAGNYVVY